MRFARDFYRPVKKIPLGSKRSMVGIDKEGHPQEINAIIVDDIVLVD